MKGHLSDNLTFQNLLKNRQRYLLKILEKSWLWAKYLKEDLYQLYQQAVLLKIMY